MSVVNEHAAIGRSLPRVDGAAKVAGVTRFAVAQSLYAWIVGIVFVSR